jgi:mitochondrial FAD-linked sulfhydryl oxidase
MIAILIVLAFLAWKICSLKHQQSPETASPPSVEELGRAAWTWLHSTISAYPDTPDIADQKAMAHLISYFARFYPCTVCRDNLKKDLDESHPPVGNRSSLEAWLCRLHNKVNQRLGKPAFDCDLAAMRWRTKTGDCSLGGVCAI